jgi:hypothetical protein
MGKVIKDKLTDLHGAEDGNENKLYRIFKIRFLLKRELKHDEHDTKYKARV